MSDTRPSKKLISTEQGVVLSVLLVILLLIAYIYGRNMVGKAILAIIGLFFAYWIVLFVIFLAGLPGMTLNPKKYD